jgi:hypothetical protein
VSSRRCTFDPTGAEHLQHQRPVLDLKDLVPAVVDRPLQVDDLLGEAEVAASGFGLTV